MKTNLLDIRHADCMDMMREFPDKHFDLAIVDPPYGIEWGGEVSSMALAGAPERWRNKKLKGYERKDWDAEPPPPEYFKELLRVCKKAIIWGGNYFTQHLPASGGWVVWDKMKPEDWSLSQAELAWISGSGRVAIFKFLWHGFQKQEQEDRIHPTQKPVALYRWLLANYAKAGDTILDTHLGSGSSAIACHYAGHHLTACELDADYYKAACERIDRETRQQTLFTETSQPTETQTELI